MTKQSERERQMFGGFYKGKSILVTGHTGFKGSWLALWLHELGATVAGFALPPHTDPSHFKLIGLQNLVCHIEGDTRDLNAVKHAFDSAKPEIVFHLAARPIVRESYDDPKATLDTNIGGTVNVLEAIRHCQSVKAAVVVTSDKCYENMGWGWGYRENDPMGGHDPYSASKGATEIICSPSWPCHSPRRKRHRWRRLGERPYHPGLHPRPVQGRANQRPQSGCYPSLAACP
jgi:CDP-glucose 4,6-dehydratase